MLPFRNIINLLPIIKEHIPILNYDYHKGQNGRIAIVGGSKEYTGAPYFAGISSLLTGADLVHIFCSEDSATVIKSYSPELIVHPVLDKDNSEIDNWFGKLHSFVVGPGLGLKENIRNAEYIINRCTLDNIPIVIDADGLRLVENNCDLIKGHANVILTPNIVEFCRLFESAFGNSSSNAIEDVVKLAAHFGGVTIVRKGKTDIVTNGKHTVTCDTVGAPRRCGGQGDLLAGATGVFSYWLHRNTLSKALSPLDNEVVPAPVLAGAAGCLLTRSCAAAAFRKSGRATITSNLISEIHVAFEALFGASVATADCTQ